MEFIGTNLRCRQGSGPCALESQNVRRNSPLRSLIHPRGNVEFKFTTLVKYGSSEFLDDVTDPPASAYDLASRLKPQLEVPSAYAPRIILLLQNLVFRAGGISFRRLLCVADCGAPRTRRRQFRLRRVEALPELVLRSLRHKSECQTAWKKLNTPLHPKKPRSKPY